MNNFSTCSAFDISALCNQAIYQFYFEEFNRLSSLSCFVVFFSTSWIFFIPLPYIILYFNIINIIEIKTVHIRYDCVFIHLLLIKTLQSIRLSANDYGKILYLVQMTIFCCLASARWWLREMEALVAILAHKNVHFHLPPFIPTFAVQLHAFR